MRRMNKPAAAIVVDEMPPARRSLRIAVVTETWPPEVNGVAVTVARTVEGLRARGHDLQLVRPRQTHGDAAGDPQSMQEVLLRGLPIPRYPHLRMGLPATGALVSLWAHKRPDVVHVATEGPLGWSALQAARRLRLPVTTDFRTNFHAYSRHYGMGWLYKPIASYLRRFHNRAGCTMVPTESLRSELQAAGFQRTLVVARGVDTQRFTPLLRSDALRSSWGAGPGDTVVLHVGRLAPEKNLDTLLLAFEAMRRQSSSVRLVLVGDGPLRDELRARCPDVIFAGLRSGVDLATHYASGDLFLFPSLTETFGNVTPEALASGLPVLAYDYAAAAQLVKTGVNGACVPYGDRATFVHQALAWAEDLVTARAMGAAARETALGLDWERVVRQVEAAFLSVMLQHQVRGLSSTLTAGWSAP